MTQEIKTIVTILTESSQVEGLLHQAIDWAEAAGAHLDVLCLGVDRTVTGVYDAGSGAIVMPQALGVALRQAEGLTQAAREVLAQTGLGWSVEQSVAPLVDVQRQVAEFARFSDLVILSQPYAAGQGAELEAVTEAALFAGAAPVLVLPEGAMRDKISRAVVAWNQSSEALRAVRAAVPMLKEADTVEIVVVDPPRHGPGRSDPGGSLAQWLVRHGVRVGISVLARSLPRVSDVLARHSAEQGADLLVMGAYGHSRFRESILGGATRNMLEQAKLPVLMVH